MGSRLVGPMMETYNGPATYGDHPIGGADVSVSSLVQQENILEILTEGVAVVCRDLRIQWANATFAQWCGGPVVGKVLHEALGTTAFLGPDTAPFSTALEGRAASAQVALRGDRYLELGVTPILDAGGQVRQLIVLGRDVTAEVQQQQKLDALHQAGR